MPFFGATSLYIPTRGVLHYWRQQNLSPTPALDIIIKLASTTTVGSTFVALRAWEQSGIPQILCRIVLFSILSSPRMRFYKWSIYITTTSQRRKSRGWYYGWDIRQLPICSTVSYHAIGFGDYMHLLAYLWISVLETCNWPDYSHEKLVCIGKGAAEKKCHIGAAQCHWPYRTSLVRGRRPSSNCELGLIEAILDLSWIPITLAPPRCISLSRELEVVEGRELLQFPPEYE